MASFLLRFTQGSLWHFVWIAVVLSCLLSLLFSRLIHGHVTWDYPFTAGLISLMVALAVVSLINRMRALETIVTEAKRDHAQNLQARAEAEAAFRQSEERFRLFMDQGPVIAWMKDEQGRHVYVNEVFTRRFQMRQEQCLGRTDFEMFPGEVARQLREHDRMILAEGAPKEFVEAAPDPDGTLRDWWVFKFPFQDHAHKRFVGGVAIDVTEQRRTEAALKVSEERLRLAFQAAHLGLWDWDIRSNAAQWSENVPAVFGLSREAFAGTYEAYLSLVHPEDFDRLLKAISQAIQADADTRLNIGSSGRMGLCAGWLVAATCCATPAARPCACWARSWM
ncbi:MAG: putative Sensor histidine kinase [Nitrospira sp.]|nr:putative Sensor histidine kinase [Nitrospira sp.]